MTAREINETEMVFASRQRGQGSNFAFKALGFETYEALAYVSEREGQENITISLRAADYLSQNL